MEFGQLIQKPCVKSYNKWCKSFEELAILATPISFAAIQFIKTIFPLGNVLGLITVFGINNSKSLGHLPIDLSILSSVLMLLLVYH